MSEVMIEVLDAVIVISQAEWGFINVLFGLNTC